MQRPSRRTDAQRRRQHSDRPLVTVHLVLADADEHNGPHVVSAHLDYDDAASALHAQQRRGLHIESVAAR